MGLSRLDNFLKSVRGTIIYVDPNSIDATDSIENQGNSLTRPFKTLQRALVEASRFSYQSGLDNDRFNKTTIVLYPGDHVVDNRPGWIPDGSNNYRLRSGLTSNDYGAWDLTTNFDLSTENNVLYKLNSIHGGVIIPRGTSIVGMDLRKTRIRPKYVPNPENDEIERSAVFRVTGGCYFWQFSILDADPNDICYKDYTTNQFVPNFSHHKLTAFEYADGVNDVSINDDFQTYSTDRTDLDMYYEKIGLAYGQSSGRPIEPDYPSSGLDIQTKIDEYRIVGSRGKEVGITSIRSGDGVTSSTTITVTLAEVATDFDVDTPIQIQGVGSAGYDGQFVVFNKVDANNIQYRVQNSPANPLPTVTSATINIAVDTVTSASPYIFNISMRSVYGMCGLHADGDKASGFKSMVVAQFTGIGLQKDDNAFVKYNADSGIYEDSTASGNDNLHSNSRARFKPSYENYHIKASNDGYIQVVSVFAIGYANHFLSENGGDQSINNSNSNFGAKSLVSSGFRRDAFPRDDIGYITHVITPKENENTETSIEFGSLDVNKIVGFANTNRLYLYNQTNSSIAPEEVVDGYRIGAKENDRLNVLISSGGISTSYSARIIMPNTEYTANETSYEKKFKVGRSIAGINSITSNVLTLTSDHSFINGESIRIISETGQLPDGLTNNTVYFAITSGVGIATVSQIKIAQTLNDALSDSAVTINNGGGILNVVSRVSDKRSGDIGHPIQYDADASQWYVNVSTAATERGLYDVVVGLGSTGLGAATPRTFITRQPDTRNLSDTIYRLRYVIPADSPLTARPPLDGYVIQESNASIGSTNTEVGFLYNPTSATLANSTQLRNPRYIANASWSGGTANIVTEIPHGLKVGSQVEILNVTSTNNTTGVANSAYNGTFDVAGISSAKQFSVAITNNPGTFTNNTSNRTTSLPYFKKKKTPGTYFVYRTQELQEYVPGQQDGVYHLLVLNTSNSPSVAPFDSLRFSQPIQSLYPQTNRDNPVSDPQPAVSFALPDTIGQVVVNEPQYSITKENLNKQLVDNTVGFGLTNIISGVAGTTHTLYTNIDHGLNRVTSLGILNAGTNYVDGNYYNASLVGFAGSTTGSHATARITVSGGVITALKIIDGGSAYGVGNTLAVVGVATTSGNTGAVLQVNSIYSNVGDTLSIDSISPSTYSQYNTLYRVTAVNGPKEVVVASASTISPAYTTGIGATAESGNVIVTGRSLNVFSLVYDNTVGLATVTTFNTHGLKVDSKVRLGGANDSFFNGDFIVKQVGTTTSFVLNVGVSTLSPSTSGSIVVYQPAYTSTGGNVLRTNESTTARIVSEYAGITTTISSAVTVTDSSIAIANVTNFDFNIGDYLLVDDEIMRIKSLVTGNPVSVFRGLLGTFQSTHNSGSVIKRIKPRPIELRRNSLIRASAHTFEYLGYGPGNYSTAFPERQDRNISPQEELLAQSTKTDGGIAIFTAMNADGDFYTGNKKVNSATGQEEVFDAPIPTVTGEDPGIGGVNVGFDVLSPLEATISRSLRVEGGPDANLISEFDGPVIFNNKITSTSDKGIEANSLFLQGDTTVSRKYTVGISTPVLAGNIGDVVYNGVPIGNDYLGWVYTSNNVWENFGYIGNFEDARVGIASGGTFVGITTLIDFRSGIGATITSQYDNISGIGTIIFDASPLNVGVSTGIGLTKTFVGVATEINFIGYGVTISATYNAGIASVTFDASSGGSGTPSAPVNSIQYNDSGFFGGNSSFTYDGSVVRLNNSTSDSLLRITQTGSGNVLEAQDSSGDTTSFVIDSDGKIGIGISVPTAKVDIVAGTDQAVYIRSVSGSGNIIRIDDTSGDTTPLVYTVSGDLGLGTLTPNTKLDVIGNIGLNGALRLYNSGRTSYVSLQSPTSSPNLTFTLPNNYGSGGQVLTTNGAGGLSWASVSGGGATGVTRIIAGSNIIISSTGGSGTGDVTISATGTAGGVTSLNAGSGISLSASTGAITVTNSGVTQLTAGTGISISGSTGSITISSSAGSSPYPFTTRGFSMPL